MIAFINEFSCFYSTQMEMRENFLIIPTKIKQKIIDLVHKKAEYGGGVIVDGCQVDSVEMNEGNEELVDYERSKYKITYHTHPRRAMHDESFLPPSPFDIIAYSLADEYVYNDNKISFVFGKEGFYVLKVIKKMKPPTADLLEYLRIAHYELVCLFRTCEDIFDHKNDLLEMFSYIKNIYGVEIVFRDWDECDLVDISTIDTSTKDEKYSEFNRREIQLYSPD
jgi:hypothetical protein